MHTEAPAAEDEEGPAKNWRAFCAPTWAERGCEMGYPRWTLPLASGIGLNSTEVGRPVHPHFGIRAARDTLGRRPVLGVSWPVDA